MGFAQKTRRNGARALGKTLREMGKTVRTLGKIVREMGKSAGETGSAQATWRLAAKTLGGGGGRLRADIF